MVSSLQMLCKLRADMSRQIFTAVFKQLGPKPSSVFMSGQSGGAGSASLREDVNYSWTPDCIIGLRGVGRDVLPLND